jgi:Flp pilus assembly protein TadG
MNRKQHATRARGTTVIEVALVLPVLLLLMMGIFDFSRMFYARLTMQHAVREAVRFAVTGNTTNDPSTGNPRSRVDSIKAKIVQNAVNLNVDLNTVAINPSDGGGPGDVVTVSADFSYPFMTPIIRPLVPGGRYDFTVASSMKNEPFYP